ncbi:MAG: fibronectin type III domain-containing protein, partial [Actinomycetia bacterium]|nr:fibronectin type III domain-containing protein [Actinomycetes bacterium]
TWESAGTSTSFVKNGLTNGVTYNVRVRATNEVGNGPVASAGAIKVWDTPPPTGPPSASAGNARATVNWNTPENGGTALTRVEVDIDPGTSWAGNPTTSHTFTGLSNGTGYRFRVRYQNAVGWGGWSAWSNTVTPQAPPALSANFTVEHATLPGSFWISLTATNFSPNTSYTLTCSDSEPNFWSQPATTNGAGGYTDTALCFTNESPVTMRMGGVSVTISR